MPGGGIKLSKVGLKMPLVLQRLYCGKRVGRYRIIEPLGQGRYGVCFLAETNGTRVVLKKLKIPLFQRRSFGKINEAEILAQLCHPGIPLLLEVIREKRFLGFALEHKSGSTIETMLFKHKHRFSPYEIYIIGAQLIDIIGHFHERGIIHGDIRIPNVLMDNNRVSLVDFGLARQEDNLRYRRETDFSYLGDFLLYLLYSTYSKKNRKSLPWYEELSLTSKQINFLKRLLSLETPYVHIQGVAEDFRSIFGIWDAN